MRIKAKFRFPFKVIYLQIIQLEPITSENNSVHTLMDYLQELRVLVVLRLLNELLAATKRVRRIVAEFSDSPYLFSYASLIKYLVNDSLDFHLLVFPKGKPL